MLLIAGMSFVTQTEDGFEYQQWDGHLAISGVATNAATLAALIDAVSGSMVARDSPVVT